MPGPGRGRLRQDPEALLLGRPGSADWPHNPDPDGLGNARCSALQPAKPQRSGLSGSGLGLAGMWCTGVDSASAGGTALAHAGHAQRGDGRYAESDIYVRKL